MPETMSAADIAAIQGRQGAFQSGQADAFVLGSELFSASPSYIGQYYNRNNQRLTTLAKIRTMFPGRLTTAAADSPIIGHFEGIQMRNTVTISAIAAGSQTSEAVLTIAPADRYTETPEGAPAPVTRTRPRVQDTLEAVALGGKYVVTAKSADQTQITVRSFSGLAPSTEITAGAVLRVGAPIKSEATNQIAPLRKIRARYTNRFWISDETDVVSGSHLTSRANAQMLADGRIYWEGVKDAEFRMEYAKSDIFLTGQLVEDGNSIAMYSDPLKENTYLSGTQGLLDYTQMIGETFEIPSTGMTLDDFYEITNIYHDLGIGVETLMALLGSNVNQKWEAAIREVVNYNWVIGVSDQYVPSAAKPYWGTSQEAIQGSFVSLGINGFEINNVKFLKTTAPEFNDTANGGAIGYKDIGVMFPMGYIPTMNGNDIPRIGYQYRGVSGYSRENELWVRTGAGNTSILTGTMFNQLTKSSEWDAAEFFLRSEIAPEFAGGDQFMLFTTEA